MQMHSLAFDVSHTLAGGLVLISLMMLYQDRLYSLLNVFALHALVLSLSVAWQAFIQDAPHLYVTAVIALVFKAIVIPVALHRIVKQLGIHRDIESAVGIGDERRRPAGARGSRLCAVGGAARTSGHGDAPQCGQPGCRVHVA
jgi:hydrogenase-4 component E